MSGGRKWFSAPGSLSAGMPWSSFMLMQNSRAWTPVSVRLHDLMSGCVPSTLRSAS